MVLTLTATSRPGYLGQVLEALAAVEGIGDCVLVASVEPISSEVLRLVEQVDFCDRHVYVNQTVLGPAPNTFAAIHRGLALGEEAVVHLEDDVLPAPDLLAYMGWALDRYRDDPTVLCVGGWSGETPRPGEEHAARRVPHFCPQIWGVWRDRWQGVFAPGWDHRLPGEPGYIGWDWNINRNLRDERVQLRPVLSRAQHIGIEGGVHATPETFEADRAPAFAGDLGIASGDYRELT